MKKIKKLKDLKAGFYIRCWSNDFVPQGIEVLRLDGVPFKNGGREYSSNEFKMKCSKWNPQGYKYTSDMGVTADYNTCFKFSNKTLNKLKNATLDQFLTMCGFPVNKSNMFGWSYLTEDWDEDYEH